MTSAALLPLLVLATGVAVDLWVYADARKRAEAGDPVVFRAGRLVIDAPAAWAAGCLLLWVVFLPLYLTSRA